MADLQAVLFDMDDTLIDWSGFRGDYFELERPHFEHLRAYVKANGYDLPDMDTLLFGFRDLAITHWSNAREKLFAPQLTEVVRQLFQRHGVPAELLSDAALIEHYHWRKIPGTTVFPEVPDVLAQLIDAGVKIGVVTNAFQPMVMRDIELREHGLFKFFPTCRFSAADVGYLKPHPAIFETALDCLGTSVASTVFVGDSLSADIAGGNRMGMTTVWRNVETHRDNPITRATIRPDLTITSLTQMLDDFDTRFPNWRV